MSEIKTFRAASLEAAMELVRQDLGEEAVILQSREVAQNRLLTWLKAKTEIEVTAGIGSRWERAAIDFSNSAGLDLESLNEEPLNSSEEQNEPALESIESEDKTQEPTRLSALEERLNSIQSMLEQMGQQQIVSSSVDVPVELFDLYAELIDVDLDESLARDLIYRLRQEAGALISEQPDRARHLLTGMVERELNCSGPIQVVAQQQKVVALVGPTGVGKRPPSPSLPRIFAFVME